MKQRCDNPNNPKFSVYGGRGIKVCERWRESYEAFLEDVGRRPSPLHSLDRRDVNGHYEPSNVRWVTMLEQQNNRQKNRMITAFGQTLTAREWARRTGIGYYTLCQRVYRAGWSPEVALTDPVRPGKRAH
jgi:hypothetical protein